MSSEHNSSAGVVAHTEPFTYTSVGSTPFDASGNGAAGDRNKNGSDAKAIAERIEKEAFDRGVRETESRLRAQLDAETASARSSVGHALAEFKAEREAYFARVEPEVVQLSLAIARKILHREAQMDPLLLTGMVHVALEKLDAGTLVRLRAHPDDVAFWANYFSQPSGARPSPELIGDASLQRGECLLESEVGSTQMSLETQLKEIEQGFFDLLDQRPRAR